MHDRDALVINLDSIARCLDKDGHPAMAGIVRDAIAMLKEQESLSDALTVSIKLARKYMEKYKELMSEQEPVRPKKGLWIRPTYQDCHCSRCKMQPEHEPGESVPLYPYCPYCGAEMEVKWSADD